jgi:hypothetical protein
MSFATVFVSAVLLAQPSASAGQQWESRYTLSCAGAGLPRWEATNAYAAAPEASVFAYERWERLQMPAARPEGHQLVYVDLSSGQERAVLELARGASLSGAISISRNGSAVAVMRQNFSSDWQPYMVSIWFPRTDPNSLHDYERTLEFKTLEKELSFDVVSGVGSSVSIAPDGTKVAYVAAVSHQASQTEESSPVEVSANMAIGILDLGTGDISVINLPFKRPRGGLDWQLCWSDDGSVVYAALHGDSEHWMTTSLPTGGGTSILVEPQRALYKCSPNDGSVVALGELPTGRLEFDGFDDVTTISTRRADQPGAVVGSYSVRPLRQESGAETQPASALSAGLAGETDVAVCPREASLVTIRDVFPGPTRTFTLAVVQEEGRKCTVVLERPRATAVGR